MYNINVPKDITFIKDTNGIFDIGILKQKQDIAIDDYYKNKVLISLFTWRRDNNFLKDNENKYGWWGNSVSENKDISDVTIGSRLYQMEGEKLSKQNILKIEDFIKEALSWADEDKNIKEWSFVIKKDLNILEIVVEFKFKNGVSSIINIKDLEDKINYAA